MGGWRAVVVMDVDGMSCRGKGEGDKVWGVDCCLPGAHGNSLTYKEAGSRYSLLREDCMVGWVSYYCLYPRVPLWLLDCEDVVGC